MSDYEFPYPSDELATEYPFVPLQSERFTQEDMFARALALRVDLERRRSVRMFAADPVPQSLIEMAIQTAATAPSGSWHAS